MAVEVLKSSECNGVCVSCDRHLPGYELVLHVNSWEGYQDAEICLDCLREAVKIIEERQAAKVAAGTKWNSSSDPTEYGVYLVTVRDQDGDVEVATRHFHPTGSPVVKRGWDKNSMFGRETVLAWMPLPPPFMIPEAVK